MFFVPRLMFSVRQFEVYTTGEIRASLVAEFSALFRIIAQASGDSCLSSLPEKKV